MEVYGVSFVLYMLLLIWFVAASLVVNGKARKFHTVRGYEIAETPKIVNYTLAAILVVSVIICLFKPEFIPDNRMYEYWFDKRSTTKDDIEPTFQLAITVLPNFLTLLGIFATLSVGFNLLAIRLISPNMWLSLLTYFSLWFVLHDMIQIRVAVAAAIALFSLVFLQSRKPLYFFLMMACAFMFHYSSVIFAVFYFFSTKRTYKYLYYAIILLSFVIFFSGAALGYIASYIPIDFVQAYVTAYADSTQHTMSGIGIVWIVRLLMGVVMIARIDTIRERFPYAVIVVKIYVISMLSFILFMDIPVMAARVSELLGVINIFAFAMFPLSFPKFRHVLSFMVVVILCYSSYNAINMMTIPRYIDRIDNMGASRR